MKKPFENKTNSPMYVGGVMIPPGELAVVEVPDEEGAPAAPERPLTLAEQVALLLQDSAAKVAASLPELNDDTLDMAQALEEGAKKPRESLLAALADERMERANDKLEAISRPVTAILGGAPLVAGGLGELTSAHLSDEYFAELLGGNVATVTTALAGLGPNDLVRLRELEASNLKPRKGVLEAIDAAAVAATNKALNLTSESL